MEKTLSSSMLIDKRLHLKRDTEILQNNFQLKPNPAYAIDN